MYLSIDTFLIEYLDTIELYNSQTNKWETTNKKYNGELSGFGFLKIKLSDIIPELRCSVDYFRSKVSHAMLQYRKDENLKMYIAYKKSEL